MGNTDFTGFSFGKWHSDDCNIIRVSGGDRYSEQLYPEIKDIVAEVPGVNGNYYFGSDYGTRQFDIEIAFDHLTEVQFRELRRTFGTKEIQTLIFDEHPYKYYMAKLANPIELSYICFDEPNYEWSKIPLYYDEEAGHTVYAQGIDGDFEYKSYDETTRRIYKGEGTISFICYFPFAKSVYKQLPSSEEESDWVISSGILNAEQYANIDTYNNNSITVYNPGDVATGFRLYLPAEALNSTTTLTYRVDNNHPISTLALKAMSLESGDVGVLVDTNNGLITGVSTAPVFDPIGGKYNYTTSGHLYNQYVDSGYFFHLEPNSLYIYSTLQITGGTNGIKIFYDYLYF